jgi:hypothetical protein
LVLNTGGCDMQTIDEELNGKEKKATWPDVGSENGVEK